MQLLRDNCIRDTIILSEMLLYILQIRFLESQVPTNKRIYYKQPIVYSYKKIILISKKEKTTGKCDIIDVFQNTMLSKQSQTQKSIHCMIPFLSNSRTSKVILRDGYQLSRGVRELLGITETFCILRAVWMNTIIRCVNSII